MPAQNIIHDLLFLQQKSVPASNSNKDKQIVQDLKDTLIANSGIAAGLAANMIGKRKDILALYVGPFPVVIINPVIVKKSSPYTANEGCLCLAGERPAKRYQNIKIKYLNDKFEPEEQEFSGLTAEVIQHEMDHFQGILI